MAPRACANQSESKISFAIVPALLHHSISKAAIFCGGLSGMARSTQTLQIIFIEKQTEITLVRFDVIDIRSRRHLPDPGALPAKRFAFEVSKPEPAPPARIVQTFAHRIDRPHGSERSCVRSASSIASAHGISAAPRHRAHPSRQSRHSESPSMSKQKARILRTRHNSMLEL